MKVRSVIVVPILFICLNVHAQLDSATQNVLIEKLDKVYLNLADNDPSKVAVTLRLADLYAERARQNTMNEAACGAGCPLPSSDREKSLRLYNEVLPRAPEAQRPKVMIQMGHLHQMNGRDEKAVSFYQKILGIEKDPQVVAEANLSVAEIHFKNRDFKKALPFYTAVIDQPKATSRGLAAYRRAWCRFHLGEGNAAISEIESVLANPELLARGGRAQVDNQFHEEVSRDYAVFLAKEGLTAAKVERLFQLSPESTRIANVQNLAFEAERLGKRAEALITWKFISGHLSQPMDRIAAQLSMAQLLFDQQDKDGALKDYTRALEVWRDVGFQDTPAQQELRRRARAFVVAWNQSEKKAPTEGLLAAYELYLGLFKQDADAHLYAAQTAKELKKYPVAYAHYSAAREIQKANPEKLESILLSQLELAETASDEAMIEQAYGDYLNLSPRQTKRTEVQYQQANRLYQKGNYERASEALRELALKTPGSSPLRKQAADLSLDALVLLKDEARLIAWSREYATSFPQNKQDFTQVTQKALLTRSAAQAESDPAAALVTLKEFDPAQATTEDKIKYYKNKMILAEKQGQLRESAAAADALLAIKETPGPDRELAWSRKAYFAELRLDFATAFAATEKQEKLPADERQFKMAVFAELSGKPSTPYYMSYLQQTKDEERRRLVAAELVRKSKSPETELEKVRGLIHAAPELVAQLYAESYAKTPKSQTLKRVVDDPKLKNTEAGRLMVREAFLIDFAKLKATVSADKLDTKTQGKLAQSIKRRAAGIDKVESMTKTAIQSGDWTAQLLSIDLLARESERFYQDLLSAPVPTGLTPEEEQQYLQLLSAQASPFQSKAAEAKAKVSEFWKGTDWAKPLEQSWKQTAIRGLIEHEVKALKEIAPEDQQTKFAIFTGANSSSPMAARPSLKDMQSARQKVFENPLDVNALRELLELERKADNRAMSEYLSARLDKLNKGSL